MLIGSAFVWQETTENMHEVPKVPNFTTPKGISPKAVCQRSQHHLAEK